MTTSKYFINRQQDGDLILRINDGGTLRDVFRLVGSTGAAILDEYLQVTNGTVASTGLVRLPNNSSIVWRNAANTGDISLTVNASDGLQFNGAAISGGLEVSYQNSNFSASISKHYLVDTSSGQVTITLPSGAGLSVDDQKRATIRFADATKTWLTNNVVITPASGERISNLAIDETLILDLNGAWVELSWNGTRWTKEDALYTSSGGGSGADPKNYIRSPDTTFGWGATGSLTLTTTTTAGELPEGGTKGRAIKLASGAGNNYAFYQFQIDTADKNKKHTVQFYLRQQTGTAAGDFRVEVWSATTVGFSSPTQLTVSTANIPVFASIGGLWLVTFDATTDDYYQLRLVRGAGSNYTTVSGVYVGPGTLTQATAISDWIAYTPVWTSTGTAPAIGNGTISGLYRRVGANMEVSITLNSGTSTTYGSGAYRFSIPSGFTFNTAQMGTLQDPIGTLLVSSVSTYYTGIVHYVAASTSITGIAHNTGSDIGQTSPYTPTAATANQRYEFHATFPVAEWAGSGVVNLGPGAQVEYAFNTSTTDATDTTSFGYGPVGTGFASITTAAKLKRVRFQSPIQVDDILRIELSKNGSSWIEVSDAAYQNTIGSFQYQTLSSTYGIGFDANSVSGTDIDVVFGAYAGPSGASYGAVGSAWASFSTYKWRVRKVRANSPVGFGLAGTDGSSGLYKPGQAPGLITGATVPAGYIGERLAPGTETYSVSVPANTGTSLKTLTLTPGVWLVQGFALPAVGSLTGGSYMYLGIGTNGTSTANADIREGQESKPASTGVFNVTLSAQRYLNVSSNTVITLIGSCGGSGGSATYADLGGRSLQAIRIA